MLIGLCDDVFDFTLFIVGSNYKSLIIYTMLIVFDVLINWKYPVSCIDCVCSE